MRVRDSSVISGPTAHAASVTGPSGKALTAASGFEERRLDLAVDDHAAGRRAFLAGVAHGAGSGERRGAVEIRVARDDHDVLAAHLHLRPECCDAPPTPRHVHQRLASR